MAPLFGSLIWLLLQVINIYIFILVVYCVLSMLVSFNVVNPRNQLVSMLMRFGFAVTEPVLAPIRRILPSFGGFDLSPLVAILLLGFIQNLIIRYATYY
jgi:YggT family protein